MRRVLLYLLTILFSLIAGCSGLSEMQKTMEDAAVVIEQNTKKTEETAAIIETNTRKMGETATRVENKTQQMEETGIIIARNTNVTRIFTDIMIYVFPVFWFSFLLLNYVLFRKIIKRLDNFSKDK
jgi:hypothetical protein